MSDVNKILKREEVKALATTLSMFHHEAEKPKSRGNLEQQQNEHYLTSQQRS